METYLGFAAGQALAIAFQWAHWKQDGTPWSAYWKNGHRARHIADAVLSVVVLLGWQSGALRSFAALLGIEDVVAKLPDTPEGMAACTFAGFVLAYGVRAVDKWIARKSEDKP